MACADAPRVRLGSVRLTARLPGERRGPTERRRLAALSTTVSATFLAAVFAAAVLAVGAGAAWADSPAPTAIQITGPGQAATVTITKEKQRDAFDAILQLVGWMATRRGDPIQPSPSALGPKFVVVVLAGSNPVQTYDLYPQADGGPRAFRPDAQPGGRHVGSAWFYAPVSMPQVLADAGVGVASGQGGGGPVAAGPVAPAPSQKPVDIGSIFSQMWRTVGLSALTAVVTVMLLGVAARWAHRSTR